MFAPGQAAAAEARRVRERIQRGLRENGTNVAQNEGDENGDGDQSEIRRPDEHRQFYREIFSQGGDLTECFTAGMVSSFGVSCVSGDVPRVEAMLKAADDCPDHPSEALLRLLERRETSMRLSPLLMIVSAGKNLSVGGTTIDGPILRQNQIKVAELLLRYGARPDAKDVCGKTVCHYGAGMMATEMTMAVVEKAAQAYKTSYMFNKEVELTGLSTGDLNGKLGVARGFLTSTGRREVYLIDERKSIAVKPENIKFLGSSNENTITDPSKRSLCDLQCRLGVVSLQETIPGNRADVAKFLIDKLGARIDIEDWDGVSPKSMAMMGGSELISSAASVIKRAATEQGHEAHKAERRKCGNCGKPEEPEKEKFARCASCLQIRYCSRSCQVMHWKSTHKKECKELVMKAEGIQLQKPPSGGMFMASFNSRTRTATAPARNADGYRRPDNVAIDETFFVKVQGGGPQMPLMIYDKTRQCMFDYPPGLPGFTEMREKVAAEPAFQGRKTYMKASFDSNGGCTIYPMTATLKKW